MRRNDPATAARDRPPIPVRPRAVCALALVAALPLAACGSDSPPPLTGNLVDARGGHAGTFPSPGDAGDDDGNDLTAATPANSQEAPR